MGWVYATAKASATTSRLAIQLTGHAVFVLETYIYIYRI